MEKDFRNFRSQKEIDEQKKLLSDPIISKTIKEHIVARSDLSASALVSLIMFANTGKEIDEEVSKELSFFGYMSEGKITDKGTEYINSENTIDKLKQMIELV